MWSAAGSLWSSPPAATPGWEPSSATRSWHSRCRKMVGRSETHPTFSVQIFRWLGLGQEQPEQCGGGGRDRGERQESCLVPELLEQESGRGSADRDRIPRSEEHTSELQSRENLV